MVITLILATTIITLGAIYWWFINTHNFFENQGIPGPKPTFLFGNWWLAWTQKLYQVELERYRKYGRIYGIYDGRTPNLYIAEPDLLRKVFIKDFDHFTNRRRFITANKYLNNGLASLANQEWKHTRSVITPAFSAGRIKQMSYLMAECVENLTAYLSKVAEGQKKINAKQLLSGLAIEVIANCAFGIRIDSLNEGDQFVKNGIKIFNPTMVRTNVTRAFFVLNVIYPGFSKILSHVTPPSVFKTMNFFTDACLDILAKRRASTEEKRHDFLDILLEAAEDEQLGPNPLKNETILVSQIVLFLLAGFDTSATAMALALHCLALNAEIQDRLRDEIRSKLQKHEFVTYDMIHELTYLEQVVAETLRLYPPAVRLERQCSQDIQYGNLKIVKGQFVSIPVFAIHRDPKNYKDPLKFDPERFTPEEKAKRDPMIYLPWGAGPRNCPGVRFALEEVKLALCHILKDYRVFPVAETVDPPDFSPGILPLLSAPNLYLGIERL